MGAPRPGPPSPTCFPTCPDRPATTSGYNKRRRKLAATANWLIRQLATDTSLWSDDVWVVDSTPCRDPPHEPEEMDRCPIVKPYEPYSDTITRHRATGQL